MYNFNRADWLSIKSEQDSVDWASAMDSTEPDIIWMNFVIILNNIINKFVPLVNIKTEFESPGSTPNVTESAKKRKHYIKSSKITKV